MAREIADSEPFTSASKNFDFYYNAFGKELDYKVGNDVDHASRKRRATLEVIDENIKHVAVTPKIYRFLVILTYFQKKKLNRI